MNATFECFKVIAERECDATRKKAGGGRIAVLQSEGRGIFPNLESIKNLTRSHRVWVSIFVSRAPVEKEQDKEVGKTGKKEEREHDIGRGKVENGGPKRVQVEHAYLS